MSKKPAKKKVVVTKKSEAKSSSSSSASSTTAKARTSSAPAQRELTFGRDNYLWMGIGLVLVIIGMFLMGGGAMDSPDVWDADKIYGFQRTVLAPFVILAGLGVEVYAIFKK